MDLCDDDDVGGDDRCWSLAVTIVDLAAVFVFVVG